MQLNRQVASVHTHEGVKAKHIGPFQELARSVLACLLWEDQFYENGISIAERISKLIVQVDPEKVSALAIEARLHHHLRHVPLLLVREMARHDKHKELVSDTLWHIIQRPDEISEFLAIYWKDGKCPISAQVKRGLAKAFTKFDAYRFAKYNRDRAIKLRDVLFLCHAKPKDNAQEEIFKQLASDTLPIPDTWEVALSAGKDKKETFVRLIQEKKLGGLALLRNLRNMREAGVDRTFLKTAILEMNIDRILPYRFIAAAKYAPELESELEQAMMRAVEKQMHLTGSTLLLVDVSGSMDSSLSEKSDLTRLDAACGLAILLREMSEDFAVCTFSNDLKSIPPRRGFALRDSIIHSQNHGGTYLGSAIKTLSEHQRDFERIIVITDEQSADPVRDPVWPHAYMINVASFKNGVGYGPWTHIDGFSERIVRYIYELELEFK